MSWGEAANIRMVESYLARRAPRLSPSVRVHSVLGMWAALRAGMGISFLGCLWADRTPELRRIGDVRAGMGVDLWLLTHPDLRQTARIRAFMSHFTEAMHPHIETMSGALPLHEPLESKEPK